MFGLPKMPIRECHCGYQTACVRSESDENGASLNPMWHAQTLDGDVTQSVRMSSVTEVGAATASVHTLCLFP